MATKAELVNQFNQFDEDTLSKLITYGSQLIIPESSMLVNVNMQDMINKAHQLADEYFPEWTDRSKSDFGQYLVELFAWFSEKDIWYQNAMANQFVLQEIVDYDIAFQRATEIGAEPQDYVPARIKVLIIFEPGSSVYIPSGTFRIKDSESGLIFSNYENITVDETDVSTRYVEFIQGVFQTSSLPFSGHFFRIPFVRSYIDKIFVDSVEWKHTDNMASASSSSKYYLQYPELLGRKIKFGDGEQGVRPEIGTTILSEFYYSEIPYNNLDNTVFELDQNNSGRLVSSFSVQELLQEGLERDSLPVLKNKAYLYRRSSGVIIRPEDLQTVLDSYDDVILSSAYVSDIILTYYVVPITGIDDTQEFLDELKERFENQVLGGLLPVGRPTTYIDLTQMDISVFILPGLSLRDKEATVREVIQNFTDPLVRAEYAESFVPSNFLNYVLSNVSGITNVIINQVQGQPQTIIQLLPGEILQKISVEGINDFEYSTSTEYIREMNGLRITVNFSE